MMKDLEKIDRSPYEKLVTVLKEREEPKRGSRKAQDSNQEVSESTSFGISLENTNVFNTLVYKFDVYNNQFIRLSSDHGYSNTNIYTFNKFMKGVKPCFKEYLVDVFIAFYKLCAKDYRYCSVYCLQFFLPIKLNFDDEYTYSVVHIIPGNRSKVVDEFCFVVMPIKEYENEALTVNIMKNHTRNLVLTEYIKRSVDAPENILTAKQLMVFKGLEEGLPSKVIAGYLGLDQNTILKYNIRIKDKLSDFFEVSFPTAMDAVDYYKKCFQ